MIASIPSGPAKRFESSSAFLYTGSSSPSVSSERRKISCPNHGISLSALASLNAIRSASVRMLVLDSSDRYLATSTLNSNRSTMNSGSKMSVA